MDKIPKIAHFYWGNKLLPFLRYMTLFSFRKLNPEWRMILYIPEKLNLSTPWPSCEGKQEYSGKNYMECLQELNIEIYQISMESFGIEECPEVHKSDLLRLYVLSNTGGLWSDMDILFFKPMENLGQLNRSEYFCFHPFFPDRTRRKFKFHSIGFLLSKGKGRFFPKLFSIAKKTINTQKYQSIGSPLYKQVVRMNDPHVGNIPMKTVYPCHRPERIFTTSSQDFLKMIDEETIGVHWYGGHPISGEHELLLQNLQEYSHNNIISYILNQQD